MPCSRLGEGFGSVDFEHVEIRFAILIYLEEHIKAETSLFLCKLSGSQMKRSFVWFFMCVNL